MNYDVYTMDGVWIGSYDYEEEAVEACIACNGYYIEREVF